jgi:hypothetical protein
MLKYYKIITQLNQHTDYNMRTFINMDFNGTQWWVEYNEDGVDKKEYFNTKSEATSFYNTFF